MTETKFTSGPLTVKSGEAIHIKAPDKSNVAQMTFLTRTGRRSADEALATANLFAAAPEIYEALEELTSDIIEILGPIDTEDADPLTRVPSIAKAKAALLKARGKS